MTNFESLDVDLDHVTGGAELDGAKYCDANFPQPQANQVCKTAFGEGAGQASQALGGVSLFGRDGKGVVYQPPKAK